MHRFFFFWFGISSVVYGQEDSTQNKKIQRIEEISVVRIVAPKPSDAYLNPRQIDALQSNDVGELLQRFPGVSLKSYGGLGGLKTVSVRGLGANHTNLTVDGFSIVNAQNGQVNLGQIRADNVQMVRLSTLENGFNLLPVSAHLSGSAIEIQTFENNCTEEGLSVRSAGKVGSFNQYEGYGGLRYTTKRFFVSGLTHLRTSLGEYACQIPNGSLIVDGTRRNNAYAELFAGGTLGLVMKKDRTLRIGYRHQQVNQELPGAAVLYVNNNDESMNTTNNRLFGDFVQKGKHWRYRVYGSFNNNYLEYNDPSYWNVEGFLINRFSQQQLNGGVVGLWYKNNWNISAGIEETHSQLYSPDVDFGNPIRDLLSSYVKSKYWFNYFQITGMVSGQLLVDRNEEASKQLFKWNQMLAISNRENNYFGSRHWRHTLSYRNSFRPASFNELYYGSIGNPDLLPELAHQVQYGMSVVPVEKTLQTLHVRVNGFTNFVQDKIIATPSQNLFNWSIQNIGLVNIYGAEGIITWTYKKRSVRLDWQLEADANYTYQYAIDVTDRSSPTYGHQIAYIPEHTGNMSMSFMTKYWGLRLSNSFVSMRYSLNENIPSNEVEGFYLLDLGALGKFEWKKQKLGLNFTVKNVLNSQYSFIRSYPMPGRNYLLTLNYALR